jgi:hypothetical protein
MGAHPLDRQVGLAGVGGAEDGPYKAVGSGGHDPNLGMAAAKRKRFSRFGVRWTLTFFNHDGPTNEVRGFDC